MLLFGFCCPPKLIIGGPALCSIFYPGTRGLMTVMLFVLVIAAPLARIVLVIKAVFFVAEMNGILVIYLFKN